MDKDHSIDALRRHQDAALRLLAETLGRGAPDNTTLVVLSAEEMTALGMRPAL